MKDPFRYISDNVSVSELLAQLAEEAAELAQAALKLRRTLRGENPTPVRLDEAREALIEELGDVTCCEALVSPAFAIDFDRDVIPVSEKKAQRWADRLKNKEDKS